MLIHMGNKPLTIVGRAIHGRLSTSFLECFLLAMFKSQAINFMTPYCSRSCCYSIVVSMHTPAHRLATLSPPPDYQRGRVLDGEERRCTGPNDQLGMAYGQGGSTCPWSRTSYGVSLSIVIHRTYYTEYGEGCASRILQSIQHQAVL